MRKSQTVAKQILGSTNPLSKKNPIQPKNLIFQNLPKSMCIIKNNLLIKVKLVMNEKYNIIIQNFKVKAEFNLNNSIYILPSFIIKIKVLF